MEEARKRKCNRDRDVVSPILMEVRSKIKKRNEEIDRRYENILMEESIPRYHTPFKMSNQWIEDEAADAGLLDDEDIKMEENEVRCKDVSKRVLASEAKDCWIEDTSDSYLSSDTSSEIEIDVGEDVSEKNGDVSTIEPCATLQQSFGLLSDHSHQVNTDPSQHNKEDCNYITEEVTKCEEGDPTFKIVMPIGQGKKPADHLHSGIQSNSAPKTEKLVDTLWQYVTQLITSNNTSRGKNALRVLQCFLENDELPTINRNKHCNCPRKRIQFLAAKCKEIEEGHKKVSKHLQEYDGAAERVKQVTLQCIESVKQHWCQTVGLKAEIQGMIRAFYNQMQDELVNFAKEHHDIYNEMQFTNDRDIKYLRQYESQQTKYLWDQIGQFRNQNDKCERLVEDLRFKELHKTCTSPYNYEVRRQKLTAYRSMCPEVEAETDLSCIPIIESQQKQGNKLTRFFTRCFGTRDNSQTETQSPTQTSQCRYMKKYLEAVATINQINLKCEGLKDEVQELQTMYHEQAKQNRHLKNNMDDCQRQLVMSQYTINSLKKHIRQLLNIRYKYISKRSSPSGHQDDWNSKMIAELNQEHLFVRCINNFQEEFFDENGENEQENEAEIPVKSFPPKIEQMILQMTDKLHRVFETQSTKSESFAVIEETFNTNINDLIESCRYLREHYTEAQYQLSKADKSLAKERRNLQSKQKKVINAITKSKIKHFDVRESKQLRALRAKLEAKDRIITSLRRKNDGVCSELNRIERLKENTNSINTQVNCVFKDEFEVEQTTQSTEFGSNIDEWRNEEEGQSHLLEARKIFSEKEMVGIVESGIDCLSYNNKKEVPEEEERTVTLAGHDAGEECVATRDSDQFRSVEQHHTSTKLSTLASPKTKSAKVLMRVETDKATPEVLSIFIVGNDASVQEKKMENNLIAEMKALRTENEALRETVKCALNTNKSRRETKRVQRALFADYEITQEINTKILRHFIHHLDGDCDSASIAVDTHPPRSKKKKSSRRMRKSKWGNMKWRRDATTDDVADPGGERSDSVC